MDKAIKLYKFVTDNNIEYHKGGYLTTDIYMFVPIYLIAEFNKILGAKVFDEEGITCVMKENYFVFEMFEICENLDIDPEEVFTKQDSN